MKNNKNILLLLIR